MVEIWPWQVLDESCASQSWAPASLSCKCLRVVACVFPNHGHCVMPHKFRAAYRGAAPAQDVHHLVQNGVSFFDGNPLFDELNKKNPPILWVPQKKTTYLPPPHKKKAEASGRPCPATCEPSARRAAPGKPGRRWPRGPKMKPTWSLGNETKD